MVELEDRKVLVHPAKVRSKSEGSFDYFMSGITRYLRTQEAMGDLFCDQVEIRLCVEREEKRPEVRYLNGMEETALS